MLETVFLAAQALAFLGWMPLFALPWIGRRRALGWARAAAAALCILYLCYFLPNAAAIPRDAGYTLAAIGRAFETRELLLAGWIHYLAFDLWVGAWEAQDAEAAGLGHGALAFCLFATMMVGPLGLLLYLVAARLARRRQRGGPRP